MSEFRMKDAKSERASHDGEVCELQAVMPTAIGNRLVIIGAQRTSEEFLLATIARLGWLSFQEHTVEYLFGYMLHTFFDERKAEQILAATEVTPASTLLLHTQTPMVCTDAGLPDTNGDLYFAKVENYADFVVLCSALASFEVTQPFCVDLITDGIDADFGADTISAACFLLHARVAEGITAESYAALVSDLLNDMETKTIEYAELFRVLDADIQSRTLRYLEDDANLGTPK